jgi:hypothetical protein
MTTTLNGFEGGRWIVTTHGSTHLFDLDEMTVTRIPGPNAAPTVNDQTRPLLEIVHCTVDECGYWLMEPEGAETEFLDYRWHLSTTIRRINPEPAPGTTPLTPGASFEADGSDD